MSLSAGDKLGPYEILSPIGAGGMGEVYRARDPRMGRDVAIKISSEQFSERFSREVHAIAALNHPNICHLYDVGPNYLVMELVDGESLKSPLPLDTALDYARQIADALEAAHEKGIVHRDLKPANIKIKPDGTVKVLDFGLAKMADPNAPEGSPESSPTMTMAAATHAGIILGTAAYMSPEQARGKPVDKRADIWAFGVVLYEMLSGRPAFEGDTTTDVLAAVVKEDVDLTRVPATLRRLLKTCLEKDPKQRLQAIGDWRLLLDEVPLAGEQRQRNWKAWALAAAFAAIAIVSTFAYLRRVPELQNAFKLTVPSPERASFAPYAPAVSPDGHRLAFVATMGRKDSLWVRDFDAVSARQLPGTEDAFNPFWSPDSRSIGFFAGGKLKRIDATGGPATSLCDFGPLAPGGSWGNTDTIVFATGAGVSRVPAAGGSATAVTKTNPALREASHAWPSFLPDGRRFLYTAYSTDKDRTAVYVEDIDSKPDSNSRRQVLKAISNAIYAPPGYLMFLREGSLMAQRFDTSKAQVIGSPILLAERVDHRAIGFTSPVVQGMFSVSQNGVLVYTSGLIQNRQLTLFDRSGKVLGTVGTPGIMYAPQFSKDGNAVVADRMDEQTGNYDLWLYDLKLGTSRRFTFNSKSSLSPTWSPDGRHIAFSSTREGDGQLYQKETGGAGQEEVLDKTPSQINPNDWSRDGRLIFSDRINPKTGRLQIWVLPLFGDPKSFPFLETEFNETTPRLSPNGRWLAYTSDETGRVEVYVQSFPKPGAKSQVSANGGNNAAWSRNGKELFFSAPDRKLMVVKVNAEAEFQASVPRPLFEMQVGPDPIGGWFDVSSDGRFLIPRAAVQAETVPITVWTNWTAGLKK